jgi:hypothetical protein
MNLLTNYLIESLIDESSDSAINKVIVIYSGRFQPFHKGHFAVYNHLVKKFGKDSVYIATSNVTDNIKSPFGFNEKRTIITKLFGVPANKVVQVKSPYKPIEILDKYDDKTTAVIFAVGEKDSTRLGGKYFKPYKSSDNLVSYNDNGYVYIIPPQEGGISASQIRASLTSGTIQQKKKAFLQAYPKFDERIFKLIIDKLSTIKKESVNESEVKVIKTSLGIDRKHMPQIQSSNVADFISFLKSKGVDVKGSAIPVKSVKMTQSNINLDKVKQLMDKEKNNLAKPVIISSDNYILDGHHRVLALYNLDDSYKLKTIKTSVDIKKLLKLASEYPKVFYKNIEEDITLNVDKGDTILTGKFKNKKTTVTDIGKDDHDMPTINGRVATTFRYAPDDIKENIITEGIDYVVCKECGVKMNQIQYRHLQYKHNMSMDDYKSKYPTAKLVSESIKNIGDKNPMKNDVTKSKHLAIMTSASHKEKISKALIGKNVGNKRPDLVDRNKSIENRKKVSESLKNTYSNNPALVQSKTHIGKTYGFGNPLLLEKLYNKMGWTRPEDRDPFKLYTELVRRKSDESYQKYFYEITNSKKRSKDFHLDHKYSIKNGFDNKIPIEVISHYKNLEVVPHSLNESKGSKNSILLEDLIKQIQYSLYPLDNRILLQCGGSYGHMNHPFDVEMNLTFGDLKNIVKKALTGKLELTTEKVDGQAIAVSWKDGRLIAARNKSHLKNAGRDAMDFQKLTDTFSGRGSVSDAFTYAMKDLESAIRGLSDSNKKKIFKNGKCFMNCEIVYPQNMNVIPYGQSVLLFHGTMEYDNDGNAISANTESASQLAKMIEKINANVQQTFSIQGPPVQKLPVNKDLKSKQGYYIQQIQKLQSEFRLSDKDGVAKYHQSWWENFVNKNAPNLDEQQKIGLVKRWAFNDKAFSIRNISDKKIKEWAEKIDKQDKLKIEKENISKFEAIFLQMGADILSFMQSVLITNPSEAKSQLIDTLQKTINQIRATGDASSIEKLEIELQKLEAIGGFEKVVPNEGIVFTYKGNVIKLTGAFAPLNQILGIFKYSR